MTTDTMSIEFMAEVCARTCVKKRRIPNGDCPIFFSVYCCRVSCNKLNIDGWVNVLSTDRNRESTVKNIKHNLKYLVNSYKTEDVAEAILQEKLRQLRKGMSGW